MKERGEKRREEKVGGVRREGKEGRESGELGRKTQEEEGTAKGNEKG